MKKRLSALLLALVAALLLTLSVFAAEPAYVTDRLERLSEEEVKELNLAAKALDEKYGVGLYICYTTGNAGEFDHAAFMEGKTDYVLMVLGERGSRLMTAGKADEIFSNPDDRDRLGYVHDEQDEWVDGIKRYHEVAEEYLIKAVPPETSAPEASDGITTGTVNEKEPEEKGFSPLYLIPIAAAVILAAVAVFFALKKKKN